MSERRRLLTVLPLLAVAALALFAAAGCTFVEGEKEVNARFEKERAAKIKPYDSPDFEGELLSKRSGEDLGKKASLDSLSDKPLVVNFWASWCPPCRSEQPDFVKMSEKYKNEVRFIGINFRDNTAPAEKFRRDYKVPYESIYDPTGRIGYKFGVRALPATFYISTDGKIIDRKLGGVTDKEIEAGIKRLLAAEKG